MVRNKQADFNAVIVSVHLKCELSREWAARAVATNALRLDEGMDQPFYVCLVDARDDELTPRELYVWEQNRYDPGDRPAVYLPQEAVEVVHDLSNGFHHPLTGFLFEAPEPAFAPSGEEVGLGMRFKPTVNMRLWTRNQVERMRGVHATR